MAATKPCRLCGSHPVLIGQPWGSWKCDDCGIYGPNGDQSGEKWDRLMFEPLLQTKDTIIRLVVGLVHARQKHPWVSRELSLIALASEFRELEEAMLAQTTRDSSKDVIEEAIDCAVVAMRIVEGA